MPDLQVTNHSHLRHILVPRHSLPSTRDENEGKRRSLPAQKQDKRCLTNSFRRCRQLAYIDPTFKLAQVYHTMLEVRLQLSTL